MKTQLLCTFAKKNNLNEIIDIIISCNTILFDKIYVFNNTNEPNNLICTYNVEFETDFMEGIPNTISLHRKKHTNTLYTINALNKIILQLNNGILDKCSNGTYAVGRSEEIVSALSSASSKTRYQ